jgi:RHS repeat-associated protein
LGKRTTYHYDDASQRQAIENPLNKRWTTTYDDAGQPTEVTDPLSNITTTVYDAAGQVSVTINPLAKRTTYTYDDAGQQTVVLDANNRRVTTVYDAAARVEASINQLNKRTTFTYDDAGQRTAIQDARGNRTTFDYDAAGRLNNQIDPLLRRTTFQYDKASRVTVRIDGKSRRTTYTYSDTGLEATRHYQDNTRVTQTYDDIDRRTELWDSTGRTTSTYDTIDRVTEVKNPAGKVITYSYYDDNRRKETVEPGAGRFTYTYDDAGRIETIVNPQLDRTTYQYDDADRRTGILRQSGNRTTITYDKASQITTIIHRNSGGSVIAAFTYTYDNVGMRTRVDEVGPVSVTWSNDGARRLVSEIRRSAGVEIYRDTFTYDDVGNRTVFHSGPGPTTYTYDAANQLETAVLGAARTTYTYDLNGNLEVENASGTRTTHTWNDENHLTQVAKTGITTNQYTFNGDGQRVQIVDSQGTKKPIWDFQNILLETDGSNTTQVVYTLEPAGYGNLISQRRGSSSYYLFDALGSTRKLVDFSGTVTDSYDYRAYGETFASSGSAVNVFRWVGELGYYFDIDRLAYYLRARPYNPAIARFLSQDPIGFIGSKWNLYSYVGCAPVQWTDPSGKDYYDDQRRGYQRCLVLANADCSRGPASDYKDCMIRKRAECEMKFPDWGGPKKTFPCQLNPEKCLKEAAAAAALGALCAELTAACWVFQEFCGAANYWCIEATEASLALAECLKKTTR